MNAQVNALNWFEISVTDLSRAKKFYEKVFDIEMPEETMMGMEMAFFPANPGNGKVSGCLCKSPYHTPSKEGAKIYLNGNPNLSHALSKIESAGGQISMPKTKINDEVGYMAMFTDTEGNLVALHSQQ